MNKSLEHFNILHRDDWASLIEGIQHEFNKKVSAQTGVPSYFDKYILECCREILSLDKSEVISKQLSKIPKPENDWLKTAINAIDTYLNKFSGKRYVTHASRLSQVESPSEIINRHQALYSQGIKQSLYWKGMPLIKSMYDYCIYPILLWNLKPKSIFEIGSGSGSSAIWMADLMQEYNCTTKVYSLDIKKVSYSHRDVIFIQGDAENLEKAFSAISNNVIEHPCLVVHDEHFHITETLEYFKQYLKAGDYFFIEDSGLYQDEISKFLSKTGNHLLVDTLYTDYFGRNTTSAKNSILVMR